MKYRHAFHAGNFADVHKHVTLLALLRALHRKEQGLLYLETHAGAGQYAPGGAAGLHGLEARGGLERLLPRAGTPPAGPATATEIHDYVAVVQALRASAGAALLPGSPLIAASALRPQDRGVCCEIQPAECRALERALRPYPRMRALCGDGYAAIAAQLPPRERRALLLIDPPYEEPRREWDSALDAIDAALRRLANAVMALWYPIKDERTLTPWLQRAAQLTAPALAAELWVHPRDTRVGLNGSGLLIVNPPWQFDSGLGRWQPELGRRLDSGGHGGTQYRWIKNATEPG
ncbi:MAG: 23S rRNA (adenine(2030)-N(6))-methyltransferase RlmJ [Gammaproteobacteria bacterium]|nr:23S rRNA (adenine(2030)-N(6))-methyltransferase RlmJ [Gammaproteobacteria bacterium]